MSQKSFCVCGKSKTFKSCCGKYLSGQEKAKTPEQLMRSRYSAYALGGYGQYLFDTWHPLMRKHLDIADLSNNTNQWKALEVLHKTQNGNEATVEFKATYIDESNHLQILQENSYFQRSSGIWLYAGANVENKRAP